MTAEAAGGGKVHDSRSGVTGRWGQAQGSA